MSMRFTRGMWLPFKSGDAHVLIQSQTVGAGGAASITFSSIPSTYRALQLRGISVSSTFNSGRLTFNGDTATANYASHELHGDGAAASSVAYTSGSLVGILFPGYSGMGRSTTTPTAFVMDVLDYASTSKNKTIRALSGGDNNGTGDVELDSGVWLSTAAVTSFTITIASGTIAQNSTFSLYGVN